MPRIFHETYLTRRLMSEEWRRRRIVEIARRNAARAGFRGRIQFARKESTPNPLFVVRIWAR